MKTHRKILFVILSIFAIFAFLVDYSISKKQNLKYGVTFSQKFSSEFGIDWKRNYLAILDDLMVKDLRLIAYWDLLEPEEGKFDFSDLDWQIEEAEKRDARVILAIGKKTPRWPECHEPKWVRRGNATPSEEKGAFSSPPPPLIVRGGGWGEELLLRYVEEVVNHYRDNPVIWAWQIENEPLFPFGECGTVGMRLLGEEVNLVKSLDSRQIILTDSGELGFAWPYLAAKSDIFGTTLYRYVNHRLFGDIKYSLIPAYYFRIKAWWASKILGKEILISELQAEPWASEFLGNVPFERQYKTMNPEIFEEIIDYAERSGFPQAYLWGAEWWYWMKEKHNKPEMWEAAKILISNSKF